MLNLRKIFNEVTADSLERGFRKWGLVDDEDKLRFLANCANETGNFTAWTEKMSYSAQRLVEVFPSAFNPAKGGKYRAADYAGQPEKLANLVYDDRKFPFKKLGNIYDGDGWKFRGRGAIQLTGRSNYTLLSKATGEDFVSNPDLLTTDKYKFEGALWFWWKNNCSACKTLAETRKKVSGGTGFALAEVQKYYDSIKLKVKN